MCESRSSIPARAGEPLLIKAVTSLSWVYPRPRGGAAQSVRTITRADGLSPPARGSLLFPPRERGGLRSIPARAGEPSLFQFLYRALPVYPRPRGGASYVVGMLDRPEGLSPPARGSRRERHPAVRRPGSIPARAGEPCSRRHSTCTKGVYPRPRGGAIRIDYIKPPLDGLSPPARGSR